MEHKYIDRLEHFEERNHLRLCSIESSAKSRTRYKRIQSTCYNFLERPNGILSISYHFALFGLVVVGLVFAILETMDGLKSNNGLILSTYILEVFLLVVFSSEYILRMWSAGCRSTYSGFFGRLRFAFKPFVIVDMVVIASTFGVIVYSSGRDLSSSVSILRFFQVLRMVRFDRQGGSWKLLGSVLFLHKQELLTTFYIGFCSLIFASFFVYQAESVENNTEFGTFADSFWWGVVTLTTVGYGDKVPKTWAGRGVAAFFAIMGISFFALPAGILGSGFALKVSQHQRQKHAKRRRRPAAMLIQCNWRYYASRKNSNLVATWSPYIKYLQETNSKKADPISEKPSQPVGRVRKISIFGRKASGLSADGLHRPEGITEQARQRGRKTARNEVFQSNDSLHDGHSYSTADQHTDDEHVLGSNHVRQKPILITDAGGNISLPSSYKQSIRFTRYLKFLVALRKFKLAKKPYDVKDVIEQYTTGHVEVLGKVKSIGNKIDEALGYKAGTEKVSENQQGRTNVVHRLSKLEKQVKSLETKLDMVITLLEDYKRKPSTPSLSEERRCCSMCGHNYYNSQHSEQHSSEELQSKETISNNDCKKPVRRRKVAISNPKLNMSGLSEREDPISKEDLTSRASLKSGQNLDRCSNNNYGARSLKIETDGHNYLSPVYGYEDGANLSRQSSTYGISDNCPSPVPSSSDESYQSKDDDNQHHNDYMILPSDGTSKDEHDDGTSPLYGQSYHAPEHGVVVDIPDQQLFGDIPRQYGTSNKGYLGTSTASSPGHVSPSYGYIPGAGHDNFSTDLSTATLPSSSPLHGGNGTSQLPDSRIPELSYHSPEDTDNDYSTVMVPPSSAQNDDSGTAGNQSSLKQPLYSGQDGSSPACRSDNTNHPHVLAYGELIDTDDKVPEQKLLLEERPLSLDEKEVNYGAGSRENLTAGETMYLEENPVSGHGQTESLPDQALSQPHSCQERRIGESKKPELKLSLEDNPRGTENADEKLHGDNCPLTKGHRTSRNTSEQRTSDGNCPANRQDDSYLSPFPCLHDERARTDSAFLSVDSENKKRHSSEARQSSDSELSDNNRSCDDVPIGTYSDIQETRM